MNRLRLVCLLGACIIAAHADASTSNPKCDWKNVVATNDCTVADMRANGLLADLSDEEALSRAWYGLAAKAGDAIGEHHMALAYFKGEGVKQDYAEALRWWEKSANQGLTIAQINMALRNIHAQGTDKDYVQAYKWLTIAARLKDESAARMLKDFESQLTPSERERATALADSWRKQ